MSDHRNQVRRYREKRRWTLLQLATVMGKPSIEAHLSRIERGLADPTGITKERIAEALGIAREDLFPYEAEEQAS
jgi:transcriptional regulator with XRE-family HTH domain